MQIGNSFTHFTEKNYPVLSLLHLYSAADFSLRVISEVTYWKCKEENQIRVILINLVCTGCSLTLKGVP